MYSLLDSKLEQFKDKYHHLIVNSIPIDITDCFLSLSENRYICPYSYGDLEFHKVFTYVVFGGTFVEKYAKNTQGKIIRDERNLPIIKLPFSLEMDIMSVICVHDLKNTSLHEIKKALIVTENIQGYKRWHTKNIENKLKYYYPSFNPEKDSAFIFAGLPSKIYPQINLNALWLSQIVSKGKYLFNNMTLHEAHLFNEVFPQKLLEGDIATIQERSYMYGQRHHNPHSIEFLKRKINLYQKIILNHTIEKI